MPATSHAILIAAAVLSAPGLCPRAGAQDGPLSRLLASTVWSVDPLGPEHFDAAGALLPGDAGGIVLHGAGEAPRWAPLRPGVFNEAALSADVSIAPGGALHLAFGAGPRLARGVEVRIGEALEIRTLGPEGGDLLHRVPDYAPAGGEAPVAVSVRWSRGRVAVESRGRRRVSLAAGPGGPGRVFIGATGNRVALSAARFRGDMGAAGAARLRHGERPEIAELPAPPDPPLFLPWSEIPAAVLAAGAGDGAEAAVGRIRQALRRNRLDEAFRDARALRDSVPGAPGPALFLALIELAFHGDAAEAWRISAGLEPSPEVLAVRAEAAWRCGLLEEARDLFEACGDRAGSALLAWARGDEPGFAALLDGLPGEARSWRSHLAAELAGFVGHAGWHRHRTREMVLLSDLPGHWRERGLLSAARFPAAVARYLEQEGAAGPAGELPPPLVAVCADHRVFDAWNRRFGGVRFREAAGVYRQGHRTIFIREDPDPLETRALLQHELVHHVLYHRAPGLPRLLEEGLAELLAHAPLSGTWLRVDAGIAPGRLRDCLAMIDGGRFPEPRALMAAGEPERIGPAREAYGAAWAALFALAGQPGRVGALLSAAGEGDGRWLDLLPSRGEVVARVLELAGR